MDIVTLHLAINSADYSDICTRRQSFRIFFDAISIGDMKSCRAAAFRYLMRLAIVLYMARSLATFRSQILRSRLFSSM